MLAIARSVAVRTSIAMPSCTAAILMRVSSAKQSERTEHADASIAFRVRLAIKALDQ